VQLIGGRFFIGQNGRRTFPLSSVYPDVSNDDEGRQLYRRSGWSLCRIARLQLRRLPVLKRTPPQSRKESQSVLLPRLEQTLFFFMLIPPFSSTLSFPGDDAIKHVSALCMFD